jgi:hypothetical protein
MKLVYILCTDCRSKYIAVRSSRLIALCPYILFSALGKLWAQRTYYVFSPRGDVDYCRICQNDSGTFGEDARMVQLHKTLDWVGTILDL